MQQPGCMLEPMAKLYPSRTLSVSINQPSADVYAFIFDPRNLPRWATQFARSIHQEGDGWIVQTPDGRAAFQFVPRNSLGVLDHMVRLESGLEVTVPMRVIPNGSGSEVLFTLFQLPEMSGAQFARDVAMVEQDLQTLKRVLEGANPMSS